MTGLLDQVGPGRSACSIVLTSMTFQSGEQGPGQQGMLQSYKEAVQRGGL